MEQNNVCYNTILNDRSDKNKNINTINSNEKIINSFVKKKELGKIGKIEIINYNNKKEIKKPERKI